MRPARLLALLLLCCAAAPLACERSGQATTVPASASTTVISMQGIDCESCGARAIEVVTKAHGEAFPPLAASWETLADIHAALGDPDQARAARQRSVDILAGNRR